MTMTADSNFLFRCYRAPNNGPSYSRQLDKTAVVIGSMAWFRWTSLLLIIPQLAWARNPLPVPPIPPANPETPAPVPDLGQQPPPPQDNKPHVKWSVTDFRAQKYEPGSAFAAGSRYRTGEDRKTLQTPGLLMRVPLE
jgi:hypothetical protein